MGNEIESTETLDVQGLNCPMPVVKTKQAIDDVPSGGVLEVVATDSGSMSDIEGWADATSGVELLEQHAEDDVYRHFVRKSE